MNAVLTGRDSDLIVTGTRGIRMTTRLSKVVSKQNAVVTPDTHPHIHIHTHTHTHTNAHTHTHTSFTRGGGHAPSELNNGRLSSEMPSNPFHVLGDMLPMMLFA